MPCGVLGGDLRHRHPARHPGPAVQVEDLTVLREQPAVRSCVARASARARRPPAASARRARPAAGQSPPPGTDSSPISALAHVHAVMLPAHRLWVHQPQTHAIPIFDGHNDALTAPNHALLATGGGDGHLDLPRMRASGDARRDLRGVRGVREQHVDPVAGARRSLHAPVRTAGPARRAQRARPRPRPAACSRWSAQGAVRIARSIADVDRAASGDGPPVVVLHFEGAEAIDPAAREPRDLVRRGPALARPGLEQAERLRPRRAVRLPVLARHRARPHRGGRRRWSRRCAELGIAVDLSHLNEAGFWDVARLDAGR